MFFSVLCPLTDCVWKLSPDKSKSLPQISCCVVQFQTPAAASMSSSWWWCLFPVCWGGYVTFQCCELGIVLRCWAPAHSVSSCFSLCPPLSTDEMLPGLAGEDFHLFCAWFPLNLKRTMQGLELVISQHSFFLEMGMGRSSNYRTFAKAQKSYSKEQCEWVTLVHLACSLQYKLYLSLNSKVATTSPLNYLHFYTLVAQL